jgi:hypothetical protein
MSYSVKLTDDVVRKLNGWHLGGNVVESNEGKRTRPEQQGT